MIHSVEKHIERMREKPEHVRKRYAFLVSGCVTVRIFFFWIASYGIQSKPVAKTQDGKTISIATPISSLTAGVGDAFNYVKELIFGANKVQYSSDNVEVVPGKI